MIDTARFRNLIPLQSLAPADRGELAAHARIVQFEPGQSPFRRGTATSSAVYLLSGEVELEGGNGKRRLQAGSEPARYALSNAPVFEESSLCLRACELLFVDRERLDRVLTWSQAGVVEVREIEQDDSDDWMATMLRSPVLQRVPPANIVRVIAAVERVEFAAGEVIIREGAPGDYYYVAVAGECRVLRSGAPDQPAVEVDRIVPGEGFGEEALVSGAPRNATVEAVTRAQLVRLSRREFDRFLREPLVQSVEFAAVDDDAQRIDVRLPDEYAGGHLPGAVNLPLRQIRERCGEIDRFRPAVLYCDGGGRSASATFLLCERGFNARWLRGGVPLSSMTER